MGLRMKNLNIFGGGITKNNIKGRGLPKNGGLGQFADLREGLARKRGMLLLRGELIPQYTLWLFSSFL